MSEHYDGRETRSPEEREAEIAARLPGVIAAAMRAPAYAERFAGIDPASVTSREALTRLPLLRKSDLPALQKAAPPFGGFVAGPPGGFGRLFISPGPIFEPEGPGPDPWRMARALFAAGFRAGDIVLNTFSYHLTPGGWIMDSGARALGCAVIPAGPGQTEQQLDLIAKVAKSPAARGAILGRPATAYAGAYHNAYFGRLEIVPQGGGLALKAGPNEPPMALRVVDGEIYVQNRAGDTFRLVFSNLSNGRFQNLELPDAAGIGWPMLTRVP